MGRTTAVRGSAVLAAAAIAISAMTAAGPTPAAAIDVVTGVSDLAPVTWVDGIGRQYTAMSAGAGGALQVARDTRDGAPDATWGITNGKKGVRPLTIAPPATGATMHRLLAASSDGTLTTVWEAAACASPTATCDRWYVRTSATGAAVGSPVLVAASPPPVRGLPDGSILTGAAGGSITWRSPSGADRGTLPVTTAALDGAGVDGGGRLLVTSTAGAITRWPVGGPADLSSSTGCTTGLAIGAGVADDGFATACGAETGVVTTRYEADGDVAWTTTGVDADHATLHPKLVAIDSSDRVWIAGNGTATAGSVVSIAAIATVTSAGAQTLGYQRWRQYISSNDWGPSGVADLRPVLGDHVAFADLKDCCNHRFLGDTAQDEVIGQILPKPAVTPTPPTCVPRSVKIIAATRTTATVSFQGCAAGSGGPAPTGYLVEDRNFYHPAATSIGLPASSDAPLTVTLTAPAPPGIAVYVSALGDDGAGPSAPLVTTFLPFRTYDAYIDRQFRDLVGHAPAPAERADALNNWVYNHDASGLITHLIAGNRATGAVEPVARLYRAYLLRDPDFSGLAYWVAKREAGATLGRISEQFARSSEFTRRYRNLTNRAFVERIYTDVLGRAGDPTGIDFWTRQLDTGRKNRGAVMVNFSESGEYVTKTAKVVQPVAAFFLMLDRMPTAADGALVSDWRREVVAYAIYRTAEYDALVPEGT